MGTLAGPVSSATLPLGPELDQIVSMRPKQATGVVCEQYLATVRGSLPFVHQQWRWRLWAAKGYLSHPVKRICLNRSQHTMLCIIYNKHIPFLWGNARSLQAIRSGGRKQNSGFCCSSFFVAVILTLGKIWFCGEEKMCSLG